MNDDAALLIGFPLMVLIVGYFVLPDAFVDMFIDILIALFKAILGFEDNGSLDSIFDNGG